MDWIAKWRALPLQWAVDPLGHRRRQPTGPEPVISVEMDGEDVTRRLMDGETVYFIPQPEPFPQPEPMAEWPEGWTVMGYMQDD